MAGLVSGDQETAIVLYTVMEIDQLCRGCWIYFLYIFCFYCTVYIPSSYTIIWYLNWNEMKMTFSQKLIAEFLFLYVI